VNWIWPKAKHSEIHFLLPEYKKRVYICSLVKRSSKYSC
jgi:hypothetical protein